MNRNRKQRGRPDTSQTPRASVLNFCFLFLYFLRSFLSWGHLRNGSILVVNGQPHLGGRSCVALSFGKPGNLSTMDFTGTPKQSGCAEQMSLSTLQPSIFPSVASLSPRDKTRERTVLTAPGSLKQRNGEGLDSSHTSDLGSASPDDVRLSPYAMCLPPYAL
jgi:hypothetical protein